MDWYAASYQRGVIDRNSGDIYTVILKKENNKWVIKTKPQIINTIYNTKDIPEDILSETASRLSPFSATLKRHNNVRIIRIFYLLANYTRRQFTIK